MELKLAVVSVCNKDGCRVETVIDNQIIDAVYSPLVQGRIKIQPDQLVAINAAADPPEIVWRWLRAVVIEIGVDTIVVDDLQGHPAKVSLVSTLPVPIEIDAEVWACSTGRDFEIHDLILDARPANPERLLKYISPIIEDIYHQ